MGHWPLVSLIRRVFEAFLRSTTFFDLFQFASQRLITAKHRPITNIIAIPLTFVFY